MLYQTMIHTSVFMRMAEDIDGSHACVLFRNHQILSADKNVPLRDEVHVVNKVSFSLDNVKGLMACPCVC